MPRASVPVLADNSSWAALAPAPAPTTPRALAWAVVLAVLLWGASVVALASVPTTMKIAARMPRASVPALPDSTSTSTRSSALAVALVLLLWGASARMWVPPGSSKRRTIAVEKMLAMATRSLAATFPADMYLSIPPKCMGLFTWARHPPTKTVVLAQASSRPVVSLSSHPAGLCLVEGRKRGQRWDLASVRKGTISTARIVSRTTMTIR
mmetsp:Transcript_10033/g.21691  ORF Transcript_10033/g.21691 Transcript_10033/m.21691 type:complete len:210 (-) Transcript_10033:209-838(-)